MVNKQISVLPCINIIDSECFIDKFNANFKFIRCKHIYLYNINFDPGYENLPETLNIITIVGFTNNSLKLLIDKLVQRKLSNLNRIDFHKCTNCPIIANLYNDVIIKLNIKSIKINDCKDFTQKQRELLLVNNIECTSS